MLFEKPGESVAYRESERRRRSWGTAAVILGLFLVGGALCVSYSNGGGWRDATLANRIIDFILVYSCGLGAMGIFRITISTNVNNMSSLQKILLSASLLEDVKKTPGHLGDMVALVRKMNNPDPDPQTIQLPDSSASGAGGKEE